jgi:hypothetical protein
MSLTATLWDMQSPAEPVGTVAVVDGELKTTGNIPDDLLHPHMWKEDGTPITPLDGDLWVTEWAKHFQFLLYATVE